MGGNKQDDFDFDLAKNIEEEEPIKELSLDEQMEEMRIDKEIAQDEVDKLKKQIATSGSPTAAIIKEARELAESPKGLNFDEFFTKHRLINVNIEQLLQAPLKKDGTYA